MTSVFVLTAKFLLALSLAVGCAFIVRHERLGNWLKSKSWGFVTWTFILQRVAAFLMVFVVVKPETVSDMNAYIFQAHSVIQGKRAFIDFETGYGPWFAWLISWPVRAWDSVGAIALVAVMFEFAAWPLWMRLLRNHFGEDKAKLAAWVYVAAPLALMNVPMVGLNHIWITAFLGAALVMMESRRDFISGLLMGASVVAVKFLSLLFAPLMFWVARKKVSWAVGLVLLPVVAYTVLWAQGADLTGQVKMHAHYDSSGNLPYLVGLTGIDPSAPQARSISNLIGLLGLAGAFFTCVGTGRLRDQRQLLLALPLFLLITLCLSKKSFSHYLELTMFPLAMLVVLERARLSTVLGFVVVMVTTCLEPSLWFRWLHQKELSAVVYHRLTGWAPATADVVMFIAVEVLMLGGYLLLGWRLWQWMSPAAPVLSNPIEHEHSRIHLHRAAEAASSEGCGQCDPAGTVPGAQTAR